VSGQNGRGQAGTRWGRKLERREVRGAKQDAHYGPILEEIVW